MNLAELVKIASSETFSSAIDVRKSGALEKIAYFILALKLFIKEK